MGPREVRTIALTAVIAVSISVSVASLFGSQKRKPDATASDQISEALSHGVNQLPKSAMSNSGAPRLQRRNPRYEVQSGDVMKIEFPYTPKFDQSVTVTPDGYITLRDAGGLHIAGQTIPEIKKDIRQAYAKILLDPEVSITLTKFENPYFLALGQVHHPGKYDLHGPMTVAEAVAMAGGFTGKGRRNDIILFRRVSDNWVSATRVNLKHMLRSRSLSEDLVVHPGDMIYVPQNELSKLKPFIPLPSMSYYLH